MEPESSVLDSLVLENMVERRRLLPVWIKVFIWIFMAFGAFVPLGLVAGLFSMRFELSLYGLQTDMPLSPVGLFISFLFLFKGVVAYGLWTEKDWAVYLGIADAILGIAVCGYVMLVLPLLHNGGNSLNLRLELVLLIPYLIRLQKIKPLWVR